MTESESVVYRVVPKCACSTIGQIMYFSDHGDFYDGDIHDAEGGIHKWALEASQEKLLKMSCPKKPMHLPVYAIPIRAFYLRFLIKFAESSAMETDIVGTWCL